MDRRTKWLVDEVDRDCTKKSWLTAGLKARCKTFEN